MNDELTAKDLVRVRDGRVRDAERKVLVKAERIFYRYARVPGVHKVRLAALREALESLWAAKASTVGGER